MQITIYHKHLSDGEASKVDDSRVDRIEYAGHAIEFRGGRIEIEPIEPARRPNMPPVMHI